MNKLFNFLLSLLFFQNVAFAQNCPNFGDLIVTEIMQNPATVNDAQGEYFEIYNRTEQPIQLQNFTLRDDGVNTHVIDDSILVPPLSYFVLGRNADTLTNGGVRVDYVYENFFLENGSDQIIIECNGQLIDRVDYDNGATFPDPTGASMNLNPEFIDAVANDSGENWCISSERINTDGDFGTPQQPNTICIAEPCVFTEVELITSSCVANDLQIVVEFAVTSGSSFYEMVNLTNGFVMATGTQSPLAATISRYSGEGDFSIQIRDALNPDCTTDALTFSTERCTPPRECPSKGDLIITEIRQNPQIVSDELGEYFEIYNSTNTSINLQDMQVRDAGNESHFIIENVEIPANEYFVFANNADLQTNGNVPVDYEYQTFTLANATDEIILQCNSTIIDSVGYDDGLTFPDPNGASMELKIDFLDAAANDDGENWQIATCQLDSTQERGTPGRATGDCTTVSATTINQINPIKIYPIPNYGLIHFQDLPNQVIEYATFDTFGRLVQNGLVDNSHSIAIQQPIGLYFLQIRIGSSVQTFRVTLVN
ncbi:MAG: lamin tail domain-containing protein [Saprospiraceae bacterium]